MSAGWIRVDDYTVQLSQVVAIGHAGTDTVTLYLSIPNPHTGQPWVIKAHGEAARRVRQVAYELVNGRPHWAEDDLQVLRDYGLGDPCAACEAEPEPPF